MERIERYKQSFWKFVFAEFVVFLSQVTVFFFVAVFVSNFLDNGERLVAFAEHKINDRALPEIGLMFLSSFLVIGVFTAFGRIFDNEYVDHYVTEILFEIPKTIYFFGSSATGTMLAITLYVYIHPDENASVPGFLALSGLFAFMAFVYGCALSYAFKRKTHVLPKNSREMPKD